MVVIKTVNTSALVNSTFVLYVARCFDNQYDAQHNDFQHNATQNNDNQHNDTQPNNK